MRNRFPLHLPILRFLLLATIIGALAGCATRRGAAKTPGDSRLRELRGVWITNVDSDVMSSHAKIAEAMDYLKSIGINTVYPVVYNGGVTLYPSGVMEREFGIAISKRFAGRDPLAEIIVEAHRNGMEVVPWFEYGFACSYQLGGGFILERHPEWAAIDQEGRLAKKNGFEWLNAFDPVVQEHLTSLIVEVATNYDVDGIQGDDRLPALPSLAGYDAKTVARYKAETGKEPPADYKDPAWVQWRADLLTDFLARLRERVHAANPSLIISMSPSIYDWCLYEYLQDSKAWMERGLVDSLHPQCYRYKVPEYKALIDDMAGKQFTPEQLQRVFPGVLIKVGRSYIAPEGDLLEEIAYNRTRGINGEVFFFYEGLRLNNNALGEALRSGPYGRPAISPLREAPSWRPQALAIAPQQAHLEGKWSPVGDALVSGGSPTARLVYEIVVPVPAEYDVYTMIPPATGGSPNAVYTKAAAAASKAVPFDQSVLATGQWEFVGRWRIGDGNPDKLVLQYGDGKTDTPLVAGPLMLLLNRRQSPGAIWPESK